MCLYNLAHQTVAGIRLLLPLGLKVLYLHPLRLAAAPGTWLDVVERFKVTDAGMSSSIAASLNQVMEDGDRLFNVASLERIAIGAEVVVPAVVKRLLNNFRVHGLGDANVSLVYSMTETGPLFYTAKPTRELVRQIDAETTAIPLDRVAAGWNVKIVDETGCVAGEGGIGKIQVHSDVKLFSGYLRGPHSDRGNIGKERPDWFDTGDIGTMKERCADHPWTRQINYHCERPQSLLRAD